MLKSCPHDPGNTADEYVMGCLSPQENAAFERHLDFCPNCRDEVTNAQVFARATREAARLLMAPRKIKLNSKCDLSSPNLRRGALPIGKVNPCSEI